MTRSFSILMSVYYKERPEFLKESLESILNQTILPEEVVIVKDGPLAEQLNTVIEYFKRTFSGKVKIIELSENKGLGVALAIGIQACSHDIVARMDSDDIATSFRFEKQLRVLLDNPEIDLIGSHIKEFIGNEANVIATRKVPLSHNEIVKFAKKRNPFNHMTVMYRKSKVLASGNYQTCFDFEDYYLWTQMLMKGAKTCNIDDYLVFARTGNDMYGRRGGFRYLKNEYIFQKRIKNIGFTRVSEMYFNILTHIIIRLIPSRLRGVAYKKFLRN